VSSPILRPSAAAIRIKEASGRAIVQNKAAPAASTSSVGYLLDLCGLDLTKARKISSVGNGVCILSTGLLAGFFGFNLPLPPSKRKKRAKLQLRARKIIFRNRVPVDFIDGYRKRPLCGRILRPILNNSLVAVLAISFSPRSALFFYAFREQDHAFGFELGASARAAKGGLGKNPVHVLF